MNIFQNILDKELTGSPDSERDSEREEENSQPEEYQHIDDRKKEEEIRKLKIGNEKEINNLVPRPMIQAIIEEVGHSIQTSFIDFARRESPLIAALLGVPEKEMQLSEILSEKIKISIDSVVSVTEKYSKDEFYE